MESEFRCHQSYAFSLISDGSTKPWWKNMGMRTNLRRSEMEDFLGLRHERSSLKHRFPVSLVENWAWSSKFEDLQSPWTLYHRTCCLPNVFKDMRMEKSCSRCLLSISCSLSDIASSSLQTHPPHLTIFTQPRVLGPSWGSQMQAIFSPLPGWRPLSWTSFHSWSPKHCFHNSANVKIFSSL